MQKLHIILFKCLEVQKSDFYLLKLHVCNSHIANIPWSYIVHYPGLAHVVMVRVSVGI